MAFVLNQKMNIVALNGAVMQIRTHSVYLGIVL